MSPYAPLAIVIWGSVLVISAWVALMTRQRRTERHLEQLEKLSTEARSIAQDFHRMRTMAEDQEATAHRSRDAFTIIAMVDAGGPSAANRSRQLARSATFETGQTSISIEFTIAVSSALRSLRLESDEATLITEVSAGPLLIFSSIAGGGSHYLAFDDTLISPAEILRITVQRF